MCRNGKEVVILRTAHGVCLLLLSGASLLPVFRDVEFKRTVFFLGLTTE